MTRRTLQILPGVYLVGGASYGLASGIACNVYLLDTGEGLLLVDAGTAEHTAGILERINALKLNGPVTHLLLTHCHFDHTGGAARLQQALGCKVVCQREDASVIRAGNGESSLAVAFGDQQQAVPVDEEFTDNWQLQQGRLKVTAWHCPGHTPGASVYLVEDNKVRILISGDVLLCDGIFPVMNAPGADIAAHKRSLARLKAGGPYDVLLPGHETLLLANVDAHLNVAIEKFNVPWLDVVPMIKGTRTFVKIAP